MLGSAETLGGFDHLFATLSKKSRIFSRQGGTPRTEVVFPLAGRGALAAALEARPDRPPRLSDIARDALIQAFAPASVVIDPNYRVLYFHGETEKFLRQPSGEPTNDLLAMARDGLRVRLRALVQKAINKGEPSSATLRLRGTDDAHDLRIVARPLPGPDDVGRLILVSFHGEDSAAPQQKAAESVTVGADVDKLENELTTLREELQSTIEQMESSNEELKASNEEVMSMNEELQSANEELETSKEELQSLNEELNTVNVQLHAKVDELESRTNDLNNLLNSTNIATLFLDSNFRIRWFTPAMKNLMELLPTDVGRPVRNFTHHFTQGTFLADAQRVLERLIPDRSEVCTEDGRWYMRVILPYRTEDNHIDGVVITFADITDLKQAEGNLRRQKDYAERIVETVGQPLTVLDPDLTVRSANRAFCELFRLDSARVAGRRIFELGNGLFDIERLRELLETALPRDGSFDSVELSHDFAGLGEKVLRLSGRMVADVGAVLLAIQDLTDLRLWERQQRLLTQELNHRVKNLLASVQAIAHITLQSSPSLAEFGPAFDGRLEALAAAHDLLTRESWRETSLDLLARAVLRVYVTADPPRIRIEQCDVRIDPHQAQAFALILHELATNAAKYGALSKPDGQVTIGCQLPANGSHAVLDWNEQDGPTVSRPEKGGFGTTLIRRSARHDLGGSAEFVYDPAGLRCRVTFRRNMKE